MTVKELEKVSAPPKTGEDAREERARILEAAALEIEVRGWAQGDYKDCLGRVCARGAVGLVTGNCPEDGCDAELVWNGHDNEYLELADFNDSIAQSSDEVTLLLRWRAEEIRDGR